MCGILGYVGYKENQCPQEIFFERIKYLFVEMQVKGARPDNDDATGLWHPYMGVLKGNLEAKDFIKTNQFLKIKDLPVPKTFIGHTRYATEGDPENNDNNHPLIGKRWIMLHNGGVEAEPDIEKIAEEYPGEVDSKYILAGLDEYEFNFVEKVRGYASILAVRRDPKYYGELLIYRDARPMYLLKDKFGIWIASTKIALKKVAEIGIPKEERALNNDLFYGEHAIFPKNNYQITELVNGGLYLIKGNKARFIKKKILPVRKKNAVTTRSHYGGHYSGYGGYYGYNDPWEETVEDVADTTNNQEENKLEEEISPASQTGDITTIVNKKIEIINKNTIEITSGLFCEDCAKTIGFQEKTKTSTTVKCSICGTYTNTFFWDKGSLKVITLSQYNTDALAQKAMIGYGIELYPFESIKINLKNITIIWGIKDKNNIYIYLHPISKDSLWRVNKGRSVKTIYSLPDSFIYIHPSSEELKVRNGKVYLKISYLAMEDEFDIDDCIIGINEELKLLMR